MREVEWLNSGMVERFATEKDTRALRGFRIKDVRTLRQRPILSYTVILNLFQNLVEILR